MNSPLGALNNETAEIQHQDSVNNDDAVIWA